MSENTHICSSLYEKEIYLSFSNNNLFLLFVGEVLVNMTVKTTGYPPNFYANESMNLGCRVVFKQTTLTNITVLITPVSIRVGCFIRNNLWYAYSNSTNSLLQRVDTPSCNTDLPNSQTKQLNVNGTVSTTLQGASLLCVAQDIQNNFYRSDLINIGRVKGKLILSMGIYIIYYYI